MRMGTSTFVNCLSALSLLLLSQCIGGGGGSSGTAGAGAGGAGGGGDAPLAANSSDSTAMNTPKSVLLSGTDAENDALIFAIVSSPLHGSLGAIDVSATNTASVLYTPNTNYTGPDSFQFTVSDGNRTSDPATFSMMVNATAGNWVAPIGIPTPDFGIGESHTMYAGLPGYSDAGNGPYTHYVDNTHGSATDNNNPNGSPTRPRVTVPRGLPAGSVVEIHGGPYTQATYPDGTIGFSGYGTPTQPIFIRGYSSSNKPRFDREIENFYEGSGYMIVENINARGFDVNGPQNSVGQDAHHICLRNSEIRGDLSGGGAGAASYSNNHIRNVVFYSNVIHHNGDVNADTDQDVHGIGIGARCHNIWMVDNEFYANSGDGIQVNSGYDWVHGEGNSDHIYIGRNISHGNKQTGFWTKQANHVIFSQNVSYNHRPGNSSFGAGMGFQYGPENVWFLYNHVFDCESGISVASNSIDQPGQNCYFIGNLIHNIHGSSFNPNTGWATGGITFWGGVQRHVVGNTIYDVDAGLNSPGTGPQVFVNNIIANVGAGNHVFLEGATSFPGSANNLLYQNGQASKVRLAGTTNNIVVGATNIGCTNNNPMFVDAANGNFRIQSSSAARDRGIASSVYNTFFTLYGLDIAKDFEGNPRPVGAVWDIGAFEYF